MKRARGLTLAAMVLLCSSACKVERTPRAFFDHDERARRELKAATEELQVQVTALGEALARGDEAAARAALAPAPGAYLVEPLREHPVAGGDSVLALLQQVMRLREMELEMRDVRVTLAPRGTVGWFVARLTAPRLADSAALRLTGVYVKERGAWHLVQAHLSLPVTPAVFAPSLYPASVAAPPAAAAPAADSATPPGES